MAPAGRLLALLAARVPASAGAMAQPHRFALELPGCGLAHFAVGAGGIEGTGGAAAPVPPVTPAAAALLGAPGCSYALCVPVAPGRDCASRVRAARLLGRLLRQLRRGPLGRCERHRLLRYEPGGEPGGLQRGVLLRDPDGRPDARRALLALLDSCPGAPRPSLAEFGCDGGRGLWLRPWELRGGRGWRQADPQRILPAPEPALHPVVPDLPHSGVFPHREAARAVLEAVSGRPFPPRMEPWVRGGGGGRGGAGAAWHSPSGPPAWLCPHCLEMPAAGTAHPDVGRLAGAQSWTQAGAGAWGMESVSSGSHRPEGAETQASGVVSSRDCNRSPARATELPAPSPSLL